MPGVRSMGLSNKLTNTPCADLIEVTLAEVVKMRRNLKTCTILVGGHLVDGPTQLNLVFIFRFLYFSVVFHVKVTNM